MNIFRYPNDTPVEFVLHMRDPNSTSVVEYVSMSECKESSVWYDMVKNRLDRIKDTAEEYVVVVMIANVINAHIIKKDKGKFAIRMHQKRHP